MPKKLSGKRLTTALDREIRKLLHEMHPHPTCFVCGNGHGWYHPQENKSGCQIGHYVSRRYFAVRWDLKNIFCQCSGCNVKHNQNPIPFTKAIIEEYGQERIDYIDKKCKAYTKMTTKAKRELLEDLRKQRKDLTNGS